MKLILGQGNPSTDYLQTRHNVGFLALDYYIKKQSLTFKSKTKFYADTAELIVKDEKIIFAKPTTFYNETGKSARALADFYKIELKNILVIHDELALPFGTVRTRERGSDAGNNGIKSLNSHLGPDYARIRVGIANEFTERISAPDFVLERFSKEEVDALQSDILPKISDLIDDFIADKLEASSHRL